MGMIDGIYLLIGTNLGDKLGNINLALKLIANEVGEIKSLSSIYQTAAWGELDQPSFYNLALRISTEKSPLLLLDSLQSIEKAMGRIKVGKWQERIIDIDILFYADQQINFSRLIVPHPEIPNRRFTLIPLCEISPDFIHPTLKKTNAQLLKDCKDLLKVTKISSLIL